MTALVPHSLVHGAVGQACALDPSAGSTAASGRAASQLALAGRHGLEGAGVRRLCSSLMSGARPSSLRGGSEIGCAEPFYRVAPPWVGTRLRPSALAPPARGYAQPPGGELAFLDDASLSLEDKLFRFMALMLKKADQELLDAMKECEAKKRAQEEKEKGGDGGGGGLFGFLGDVVGTIGDAVGGIGDLVTGAAESVAKDLGGPVLGAICTVTPGLQPLAPLALKYGGDVAALACDTASAAFRLPTQAALEGAGQLMSSADAGAASSRSSAAAGSTSPEGYDEKLEMLKLQRVVDKVNAMFQALSNVMKAMHDAQMTAVNNIR
jgi:hypothetical protein